MSSHDVPGNTTFLFTDIEGSTRLWEKEPARMADALARHDDLCRRTVVSHGGRVVKMIGDGLHAVFDDAGAAVGCVLELQRGMASIGAACGIPFKMRCGLHAGNSQRRDGDYFGTAVNRAARIMAAGHGGQILMSQSVVGLTRDRLPEGADVLHLGRVRLRDLSAPEELWQLAHADLPRNFPALRSMALPASSLPEQPSGFIGRERETAHARSVLERSRLVTMTGAGGSGKTRLALHVAAQVESAFADGCLGVMLAPVRGADQVASAFAQALGVQQTSGEAIANMVVDYLARREVLLVVDNFEHVLPAAGFIEQILQRCSGVKMLVTSRSPLRLPGEHDIVVAPLPLPAPRATPLQLAQSDAVQLFIARVPGLSSASSISDDDIATIAEICRRLDGLPLAIELAAARMRVLSPAALLARLTDRLGLLTGASPALPERQRTLRNAIAWSHDLLDSDERVLFRRLSVFAGGWDIEAAERVAENQSAGSVIDVLESLIDQSLVQRVEDVRGEPRFMMLETVREFAEHELQASGERGTMRERHALHFTALAEREEPLLTSALRKPSLRRLGVELNNLRAALAFVVAERHDCQTALRLAGALPWMWYFSGLYAEGVSWLQGALDMPVAGEDDRVARAKALSGIARLSMYSGNVPFARESAAHSVELWLEAGDRRGLAYALVHQAIASMMLRQNEAQALYERSFALFREVEDAWGIALAVTYLGILFATTPGKEHAARDALGEGLARYEALGDEWGGTASHYLGLIALRQGRLEEAWAYAQRSLAAAAEAGDPFRLSRTLHLVAETAARQHRWDTALEYLKRSVELVREQGRLGDIAQLLRLAAQIEVGREHYVAAARLFAASEKLAMHRSTLPPDNPELARLAREAAQRALGDAGFRSESAFGSTQSLDGVITSLGARRANRGIAFVKRSDRTLASRTARRR